MGTRRNSFFRTDDWADVDRGAKPDEEAAGLVGAEGLVEVDAGLVVDMRSSSLSTSISIGVLESVIVLGASDMVG